MPWCCLSCDPSWSGDSRSSLLSCMVHEHLLISWSLYAYIDECVISLNWVFEIMQLAFFTRMKVEAMEELTWVRGLKFYRSMFHIGIVWHYGLTYLMCMLYFTGLWHWLWWSWSSYEGFQMPMWKPILSRPKSLKEVVWAWCRHRVYKSF
jgi:hypothetical protein